VCLFRDSYEPLTAGGLAIYGLSTDSPKANTTFKTKQKLQYPLLCDPGAILIGAIGLKKSPKGTQRGVFAVDKAGKVLIAEPGGPAATVNAVKALVEAEGGADAAPSEPKTDEAPADEKPAEESKDDEEAKPAEEPKKDEETKPEESKKDEEAKPTNGDTTTEKKSDEAEEKPAE
jgi:thioredoxin-dependent peroxiredoxin